VDEELVEEVLLRLQGLHEDAYLIGEIVARQPEAPSLVYV
jgi:hypothetical protein